MDRTEFLFSLPLNVRKELTESPACRALVHELLTHIEHMADEEGYDPWYHRILAKYWGDPLSDLSVGDVERSH